MAAGFMLAFAFGAYASATTDEKWVSFSSATGGYDVRIPSNHSVDNSFMYIGKDVVVSSEELAAKIDQRPFYNSVQTYVVQYDQTFGVPMETKEMEKTLKNKINFFEDLYKANGAILNEKNIQKYGSLLGADLYMSFEDPEFGLQSVRIRSLIRDVSIITQIITGPDDIMYGYKSENFLRKIIYKDGLTVKEGNIADNWKYEISPLAIFSFPVPEKGEKFFTKNPLIRNSDNFEFVSLTFEDPMRQQNMFFNIYGYRFDQDITFESAEKILILKHISKQKSNYVDVRFSKKTESDRGVITTKYNIVAPEGFPEIEFVTLSAEFSGPYMIVKEVLASKYHINAEFAKNLPNSVVFHPDTAENLKISKTDLENLNLMGPGGLSITPFKEPEYNVERRKNSG